MKPGKEILNELMHAAPSLISSERSEIYCVEASYFENLPELIVEKVKNQKEAVYYFIKEMPYSIPGGYFEGLAKQVLAKTKTDFSEVADEIEMLSPLISKIGNKNVFTVPENYFDSVIVSFPVAIKETSKVISIKSKPFRSAIKWMAAAVVTGILGIGVYQLNDNKLNNDVAAKVSADIKSLSEDDILNYLKTNSASEKVISTAYGFNEKENGGRPYLLNVSDNEIQQYLQDYGEPEGI